MGLWNWNADINGNDFPDENLADLYPDDTDPDDDCGNVVVVDGQGNKYAPTCQFNDTADLDDDLDGLFDLYDVDDDNDGIWDYLEVDSDDSDWDDDANTLPPGNFFTGFNCQDNDDDGTDSDPDGDGFFQSVWDHEFRAKGFCSQSSMMSTMTMTASPTVKTGTTTTMVHLTSTKASSVSGVKNNPLGIMTTTVFSTGQTMIGTAMAGPISSENTGVNALIAPWDHDNDGLRDDIDEDDDADGMHDEDEIMLWPSRFGTQFDQPMGSRRLWKRRRNRSSKQSLHRSRRCRSRR